MAKFLSKCLHRLGFVQKNRKFDARFSKKSKTSIFGHFALKWPRFFQLLVKNCQFFNLQQKFTSPIFTNFLNPYLSGFFEQNVTAERTDTIPKVLITSWSRDQKNVASPVHQATQQNLGQICVNFGQKGPFQYFPKNYNSHIFDCRDQAS